MIPIKDEVFNNLKWKDNHDAKQLDNMFSGCCVVGIAPVDYPLTDGLIFYLRTPGGQLVALSVDADTTMLDIEEEVFSVSIAKAGYYDEQDKLHTGEKVS